MTATAKTAKAGKPKAANPKESAPKAKEAKVAKVVKVVEPVKAEQPKAAPAKAEQPKAAPKAAQPKAKAAQPKASKAAKPAKSGKAAKPAKSAAVKGAKAAKSAKTAKTVKTAQALAPKKAISKKVPQVAVKKVVKTSTFTVDCTRPVEDGLMDAAAFEKYVHDNIKFNGKKQGNVAGKLSIKREGSKINVTVIHPFSKRYLKYLSKKFLKKQSLRDWFRVIASSKNVYEIKYFNIQENEEDEEEEEEEEED